MDFVTKHHPHDYLPAAGHDALLPCYDLISRLLGIKRVHQTLIAQAELADCHRILEIGCGTGNLILRAKRDYAHLEAVGCDPDPRALDRARRKGNDVRFEHGYAERLPYADGEFDRVLSSMMLHHIDDRAKTAAAQEIFRVLRPGGRLHLVDIGGEKATDHGLLARLIRRNPHAAANLGDAIPRLLTAAGFDCTEVASEPHRVLGRLNYYRATRPA
ncbi:SAM-dependent methyltransferase [Mycobacterium sp. 852014-52450_SCH5900713]|nr:class I SAM-dependent methyltransferase [Mycobacterium sp. 852014-52450_SCH5900713]OBF91341.1 SAM-dependent methyltransferase [Mycobacterium sp. 852014-52450_SCH5900713]